jgi:hypothetical protein
MLGSNNEILQRLVGRLQIVIFLDLEGFMSRIQLLCPCILFQKHGSLEYLVKQTFSINEARFQKCKLYEAII